MSGTTGIIVSNIITIIAAIIFKWDVNLVMAGFWCQSVIIGFFNELRIGLLEEFSTVGLKINNREVSPTPAVKRQILIFFPIHYGFFHLGYLIFILTRLIGKGYAIKSVLFDIGIISIPFFISHFKDFKEKLEMDKQYVANIGKLMFFPYARIIPMHLAVFLSIFASDTMLILFLLLKMGADIVMHIVENNLYKSATKKLSIPQ